MSWVPDSLFSAFHLLVPHQVREHHLSYLSSITVVFSVFWMLFHGKWHKQFYAMTLLPVFRNIFHFCQGTSCGIQDVQILCTSTRPSNRWLGATWVTSWSKNYRDQQIQLTFYQMDMNLTISIKELAGSLGACSASVPCRGNTWGSLQS